MTKEDMETDTRGLEMDTNSEFNVFTIDPHGYKTHWRIGKGTGADELNNLAARQKQLSKWLSENGYTPDDFGRGGATFTPTSQPAAVAPQGAAVWVVNADGTKSCSVHGAAAFQPPGVSKTTGKPYTGFWKCTVRGCKPAGDN